MDDEVNPFATDYGGSGGAYGSSGAGSGNYGYSSSSQGYSSADANPFASQPSESAPPSGPPARFGAYSNSYSSSQPPPQASAPASSSKPLSFTSVADDLHTVEQLRAELKRRERELEQKNELIANLGTQLDSVDVNAKKANWPPFYPLTYHNIKEEITDEARRKHVRAAYIIWMVTSVSYVWNFLLVVIAFSAGVSKEVQGNEVMAFVWQFVLVLTGPFLAFFFWYRAIYNAAKNESPTPTVKYWWFFLHFAVHCIVVILCFVGIFFNNGGMISMINCFGNDDVGAAWGFMFLTSTLLWAIVSGASCFLLLVVFRYYRREGGRNPTRKDMEQSALIAGAQGIQQSA